jgi:translation initiation factor 2B subunit (eIF-2B alpha/beta/delta family)
MAYTIKDFKEEGILGSYTTCLNALNVLKSEIEEYKAANFELLGENLNKTARLMIKTYPNMVLLRKNVTSVVYYLKRLVKAQKSGQEIKQATIKKIGEIGVELSGKRIKIGESGTKLIQNQSKILTISYSTNLLEIFKQALKLRRKFSVYCLESRPSLEGHVMAEKIAAMGIPVTIIADAAVGQAIQEVNMVLTGADRVFENGFVSKTGSLPLAIMAQTFSTPLYIASETDKILREYEQALRFYQEDAKQIYAHRKKNISVSNVYFDSVPLHYVAKIICEDGIFNTNEFQKWYLEE